MRCTGCGLPLSPQRTHCPRCGKVAGPAKQEEQANVPQYAFSSPPENTMVSPDAETIQGQLPFAFQQQAGNQMPGQPFYAASTEEFANQPNQFLPQQDKTLLATPEQSAQWYPASQQNEYSTTPNTISSGEFQPFSHPQRPNANSKVQPGFTIAGLCVLSGGLILMLVYIISLYLPPLSTNTQSAPTAISQNASGSGTQGGLPTNITPTPSLPTATPTPTFPGKAFIDNAQMSSSIDYNTALPSQTTTTFKVNQKIFVTFMLHPP